MVDCLVSIAIPCFNHENYIIDCLESVYCLDYSPIELLIIDDGSTDQSYDLAKEWINSHLDRFSNVIIEKQNNQGVCKTLNRLSTLANGEYLAWLASDDQLTRSSINDSLMCLHSTKKNFLFSDAELIDDNGLIIAKSAFDYFKKNKVALKSSNYLKMDVLLKWDPPLQIFFMKREAFIALGGLDESLPFEDLALMLKLISIGNVAMCEKVNWRYRIRLNQRLTPGITLNRMLTGLRDVYAKNLSNYDGISLIVIKMKILQLNQNQNWLIKKMIILLIKILIFNHSVNAFYLCSYKSWR
jgi:alpha-1,3-rhamnosyltransferase